MALHTARLIFTILFLVCALSGVVTGYWLQAVFWALAALAVGYPFVRNGRIDLSYDDGPTRILVFAPVSMAAGAPAAGVPAAGAPAAGVPAAGAPAAGVPSVAETPTAGPMDVPGAAGAPAMMQQLFQGNV